MFDPQYITAVRRTLRLICPAQRWFARPSRPMYCDGLVIWNAPPGAIVFAWVCGEPISGSQDGMPARQFDAAGDFERLNRLIDWPTVDTATGVDVELRSPLGKIIALDEHPDLEIILYGRQIQR